MSHAQQPAAYELYSAAVQQYDNGEYIPAHALFQEANAQLEFSQQTTKPTVEIQQLRAGVLHYLGCLEDRRHNFGQACTLLSRAVALSFPPSPQLLLNYSSVLLHASRFEEAEEWANKSVVGLERLFTSSSTSPDVVEETARLLVIGHHNVAMAAAQKWPTDAYKAQQSLQTAVELASQHLPPTDNLRLVIEQDNKMLTFWDSTHPLTLTARHETTTIHSEGGSGTSIAAGSPLSYVREKKRDNAEWNDNTEALPPIDPIPFGLTSVPPPPTNQYNGYYGGGRVNSAPPTKHPPPPPAEYSNNNNTSNNKWCTPTGIVPAESTPSVTATPPVNQDYGKGLQYCNRYYEELTTKVNSPHRPRSAPSTTSITAQPSSITTTPQPLTPKGAIPTTSHSHSLRYSPPRLKCNPLKPDITPKRKQDGSIETDDEETKQIKFLDDSLYAEYSHFVSNRPQTMYSKGATRSPPKGSFGDTSNYQSSPTKSSNTQYHHQHPVEYSNGSTSNGWSTGGGSTSQQRHYQQHMYEGDYTYNSSSTSSTTTTTTTSTTTGLGLYNNVPPPSNINRHQLLQQQQQPPQPVPEKVQHSPQPPWYSTPTAQNVAPPTSDHVQGGWGLSKLFLLASETGDGYLKLGLLQEAAKETFPDVLTTTHQIQSLESNASANTENYEGRFAGLHTLYKGFPVKNELVSNNFNGLLMLEKLLSSLGWESVSCGTIT